MKSGYSTASSAAPAIPTGPHHQDRGSHPEVHPSPRRSYPRSQRGRPPMIIRHGSMATTYARTEDEQFAAEHGMERPEQTIGSLGSLSLISNNIVGPGMMNLPHLFRLAGVLPASMMIVFVCVCSSLCGTFLSQTIAAIPGNKNFGMGIDFSTAFNLLLGDHWYAVAETLFIMSCMVQSCSAIVQMAQCLDSLMASFFFKRTFALQILPQLDLLEWTGETCDKHAIEAGLVGTAEACTPFYDDGPMVITLGFVLVTIFYLPLGMGHIKETMWVQLASFAAMFVLVTIFVSEFMTNSGGLDHPLPWVGNDFSKLGGVVLFNFAYSTTVPAWLQEKKTEVSVNRTIWTSSLLATFVYVVFGVTAAMSFDDPGENMLTLLASPRVRPITRFAAAIFGLSIVGSGAPVFCVMMKNALYSGRLLSAQNSFLVGSILPYCISWMMYKGSVMLTVVSWAGLVINGTVAFLLPCVLVILSHYYMRLYGTGTSSGKDSGSTSRVERSENGLVIRGLSAQALHELNDLVEKSPNPDRRVITDWSSRHLLAEPPPRHDRPELGALEDVPADIPTTTPTSGAGAQQSSKKSSSTSSGGSFSRLASSKTPSRTNGGGGVVATTGVSINDASLQREEVVEDEGSPRGGGEKADSGRRGDAIDDDDDEDDEVDVGDDGSDSSSSSPSEDEDGLGPAEEEGNTTAHGGEYRDNMRSRVDEETGLLRESNAAGVNYGSAATVVRDLSGTVPISAGQALHRRSSHASRQRRRRAGPGSSSRNSSKALPPLLRPYIEHISVMVGVSFLIILMFTIAIDIKTGQV